jgi:outer membrane protein, multidrug efflux system
MACGGPVAEDQEALPPEVIAMPAAFSPAGERLLPSEWWTEFADAELNALVTRAVTHNFDLAAAWQRMRAARALLAREASALRPELDLEADFESRRPGGGDGESFGLGLSASYEIDLWGRLDSAVNAERFRADAALADYRATAISLSAELSLAWFQLLEARAQSALLQEQIATNEQVLQMIRSRVGIGEVRGVDILRQQQLIEATRARKIDADSRIELLQHLLALLVGQAPQDEVAIKAAQFPGLAQLPELPSAGLPAELVRRRPDVQRAHLLLRAADEEVAVAVSARYPRLSLSASLSTDDQGANQLFQDWLRRLAANLVLPLIDGGRRDAEVERSRALAELRLAEYGQITLQAFREVEDALVLERRQHELIASLRQQLELAEQTYAQLRAEYFNGFGEYLDVLTTLTDVQETRRDLLAARMDLIEARIVLYRALAGGFATEREEES